MQWKLIPQYTSYNDFGGTWRTHQQTAAIHVHNVTYTDSTAVHENDTLYLTLQSCTDTDPVAYVYTV